MLIVAAFAWHVNNVLGHFAGQSMPSIEAESDGLFACPCLLLARQKSICAWT